MHPDLIFYQMFEKETSTYTYLLGDHDSREAVIIDPVLETVERDLKLISELRLTLKYIMETHIHADHITGSGTLRNETGARICISAKYDTASPDIFLKHKQKISLGKFFIEALSTPGHTDGCMTYLIEGMAFTGDTLLIHGCGRTDFQDGSSEKLFHSVRDILFKLPEETLVYPAHDYKGNTHSTIALEKKFNPRLKEDVSMNAFKDIMANLKLDYPKKIKEAVPANLLCGIPSQP